MNNNGPIATAAKIYDAAADQGYGITVDLQDALEEALRVADESGDRDLFLAALARGIHAAR